MKIGKIVFNFSINVAFFNTNSHCLLNRVGKTLFNSHLHLYPYDTVLCVTIKQTVTAINAAVSSVGSGPEKSGCHYGPADGWTDREGPAALCQHYNPVRSR